MTQLFASLALAMLLLGGTLLSAKTARKSCSAGCCNSPSDCPQPACCVKK